MKHIESSKFVHAIDVRTPEFRKRFGQSYNDIPLNEVPRSAAFKTWCGKKLTEVSQYCYPSCFVDCPDCRKAGEGK